MSNFINHGIQGGFVHAFPFKLLEMIGAGCPELTSIVFGLSFMIAIAPDALSYFQEKWYPGLFQMKKETHEGFINEQFKKIPAWGLHTWQDRIFWHNPEVKQSTKDLAEVGAVILSIFLFLIII
jgi:hypothetical protein